MIPGLGVALFVGGALLIMEVTATVGMSALAREARRSGLLITRIARMAINPAIVPHKINTIVLSFDAFIAGIIPLYSLQT
jgi:hypothetical protein